MHNGRCRRHGGASTGPRTPAGKARLSARAKDVALRRWEHARSEGKNRIGKLSGEGLASIIEANAGRPKSPEQRARMSDAHKEVQAKKRVANGLELIAAHGATVVSILQPAEASPRVTGKCEQH
jgi:hypothetical protein